MHRIRAAADLLSGVAGSLIVMGLVLHQPLSAGAQSVYQWTDEKGVIHFSNSGPPKGVEFQQRNLPVPAPIASVPNNGANPAATDLAAPAKTGEKKPSGPAQLVLEDSETRRDGPDAAGFTGKVKNVGGAPARNVFVQIRVSEPAQGAECLQDEISVRPSTIGPGETAEYRGSFSNPCFFGETSVNLNPVWTQ